MQAQLDVHSHKRPLHGANEQPSKRAQPAATPVGSAGLHSGQLAAGRAPADSGSGVAGIFKGLTVVFWTRKFVASAKERCGRVVRPAGCLTNKFAVGAVLVKTTVGGGLLPQSLALKRDRCLHRAAAAGAHVEDEVCAHATHIIAERDMSAQQAADKLDGKLGHFNSFMQVPLPAR